MRTRVFLPSQIQNSCLSTHNLRIHTVTSYWDNLAAVKSFSRSAPLFSQQLLFTMRTHKFHFQTLLNLFVFVYNAYLRFPSFTRCKSSISSPSAVDTYRRWRLQYFHLFRANPWPTELHAWRKDTDFQLKRFLLWIIQIFCFDEIAFWQLLCIFPKNLSSKFSKIFSAIKMLTQPCLQPIQFNFRSFNVKRNLFLKSTCVFFTRNVIFQFSPYLS